MYTFRKIKLSHWDNAEWYFYPTSINDIFVHFHTICKREMDAGIKEYFENAIIGDDGHIWHPHPDTPFGVGVDVLSNTRGIPWIQAAVILENQTLNDRLNAFRKNNGIYLADNMKWFTDQENTGVEILEEKQLSEMEFPAEELFKYSDIRVMKWDIPGMSIRGTHWYAKVGKYDVVDKNGKMKWNTEQDAINAGRLWVDEYNRKESMNFKYVRGKKVRNKKPM